MCQKKKYDHVSGILKELHWLPSEARTYFKILCYVYKCIHNLAPRYLSDLITIKRSHNLSLAIPRCRTQVGDRAFKCAGPRLWNALPVEIRMKDTLDKFKAILKHHLFTNFQQYKIHIDIYRSQSYVLVFCTTSLICGMCIIHTSHILKILFIYLTS